METVDSPVAGDPFVAVYADAIAHLAARGVAFLVGGMFAVSRYTSIGRGTKDLDIFVRPADVARTLLAFEDAGYRTELTFPHWLAKVACGEDILDVIFGFGNGIAQVDDEWFTHAAESEVFGMRARLCPLEEMIWSKSFVQERERFDGADVLHLLREAGPNIDWRRLLRRFGDHWPVLFGHLVMFSFVYPDCRDRVPAGVMQELVDRLLLQQQEPANRVCFGTLLSRQQYLQDVKPLGYTDARLRPSGAMTPEDVRVWTEDIWKKRAGPMSQEGRATCRRMCK